jgi:hypothetical protein
MRINRFYFIALAAGVMLLAACTRSASALPTELLPTEDPIESIFSTVATQTALAAQSETGNDELEEEATPAITPSLSGDLTATPTPTEANTPAPTPDLVVPSSYTLHEGEWPYCLARRFDIEASALLSANGLSETQANQLSVGYTMNIPAGAASYGGERSLRAHPTNYTASGVDTFYSIACLFGDVWPEAIAAVNGKGLNYTPSGGEQLYIP